VNHHQLTKVASAAWLAVTTDAVRCHGWPDIHSVRHLLHDESGQDMIEYAMVAALVGLGVLAAMKGLKNSIGTAFNGVGNSLANA
jgi:pilus assembly protein Flp/PilA